MSEQIVTDNKEIIFGYHRKPTQEEDIPDNIICPFCNKPKNFLGRYYFCPTCKNIKTSSGLPASKISREVLLKVEKKKT